MKRQAGLNLKEVEATGVRVDRDGLGKSPRSSARDVDGVPFRSPSQLWLPRRQWFPVAPALVQLRAVGGGLRLQIGRPPGWGIFFVHLLSTPFEHRSLGISRGSKVARNAPRTVLSSISGAMGDVCF